METRNSIIKNIETYVNSSTSIAQQNASAKAIASLLKNDKITMEYLVREMELYLTTTDDILRARGLLLLAEVLGLLQLKHLNDVTIHTLVGFFTERLTDWRALRGALVGCLSLVRRKKTVGVITVTDAKALAQSYLENLQVQSLGQHDRKLCFELLDCLLDRYPESFSNLGDHLVYGVCEAIEGEKDPQCLVHVFHIVEGVSRIYPDPAGPVASVAEELFDTIGRYFPIHYTHPKNEDVDVSRDDLSRALMMAFSASPFFEPFAIPLLLEKLASTLPLAKIDSLKYLSHCTEKYGPERLEKYLADIWSSVKAAICDFTSENNSLVLDLPHGQDYQESEITRGAMNLVQKLVSIENYSFLNLVLQDEDVRSLIDSVADSGGSYESLPQNKNKLHSVGRLLSNVTKASTASCNVVFESVFIRLSNSLLLPPNAASQNAVMVGSHVACQKLNFSALFLCVEILDACRELAAASARLAPSTSFLEDTWCQMLVGCSSLLVKTFGSDLAIADEMFHITDISLRVKGLQILATFPGGSLPVSTSIFDGILVTLVSIVTEKPTLTSLRKMSLNALVEIGTFLHEYPSPEKLESYLSTVIEKIILLISVDVSTMPLSLALEALSEICASGRSFMPRIVEALQEAMSTIFIKVFVDGDMEQAKKLVQLLDCYSNILPRYHKVEGLGSVPLRFATDIWDHIEAAMKLDFCVTGEELLNATKRALKQAVTMCSEDDQCTLLQKAFRVISSSNSFSPKSVSSQLVGLKITQDMDCLSGKDKWLMSLFGSVIIALHPQTELPNTQAVIEFLLVNFLKGDVTSAQALGSIVNKMALKDRQIQNQSYMCLDDVLELIIRMTLGSCRDFFLQDGFKMVNQSESCLSFGDCFVFQTKCISRLAWIGKGLLLRGHARLKDITMIFFKFLVSSNELEALFDQSNWLERDKGMILSLMNSAADAFHVLLSDSEDCLNKTFHASVRPLYKQRLFTFVMPFFLSSAMTTSREARSTLYRAIGHVICDTPLVAVLAERKKLLPVFVDVIAVLSEDLINKDLIYNLLLVLSGILLDKNGQETASDNAHVIINCLTKLLSYPHKMLVRETAVQCLVAMSAMSHTRIYPMRTQVLGALSKVLDDPKRSVRVEAVRCRQAWASIV
ncbi:MMS19 nucleotide excision repair protein homolog [Silene latifolia]|uniref:MMS19 nucleotide excision repair protein homolog n=1 Tax=Silene latifolia TaxID=37657 RepID=UPI003D77B057